MKVFNLALSFIQSREDITKLTLAKDTKQVLLWQRGISFRIFFGGKLTNLFRAVVNLEKASEFAGPATVGQCITLRWESGIPLSDTLAAILLSAAQECPDQSGNTDTASDTAHKEQTQNPES